MVYTAPPSQNVAKIAPGYRGDSVGTAATATAPGAGGVVATITPAAAGRYVVDVMVGYLVTAPAAAEDNNMELRVDGTTVARMFVPRALNVPVLHRYAVTVNGAQAITVNAVGAATASVVYSASIVATPVA